MGMGRRLPASIQGRRKKNRTVTFYMAVRRRSSKQTRDAICAACTITISATYPSHSYQAASSGLSTSCAFSASLPYHPTSTILHNYLYLPKTLLPLPTYLYPLLARHFLDLVVVSAWMCNAMPIETDYCCCMTIRWRAACALLLHTVPGSCLRTRPTATHLPAWFFLSVHFHLLCCMLRCAFHRGCCAHERRQQQNGRTENQHMAGETAFCRRANFAGATITAFLYSLLAALAGCL